MKKHHPTEARDRYGAANLRAMGGLIGESLRPHYKDALDSLESALRECPGSLWEASMWSVDWPERWGPVVTAEGIEPEDDDARAGIIQSQSSVWKVAHHALECLDYDLTGEFDPKPWKPFFEEDFKIVTRVYSRDELLAYVAHMKRRVDEKLAALSDEDAARPLPRPHRYEGKPFAWLLIGDAMHTAEHAAQIRQFFTRGAR